MIVIRTFILSSQEVSICTLGPDFDKDGTVDVAKHIRIVYGEVKRLSIYFYEKFLSPSIHNILVDCRGICGRLPK